MEENQTPSSPQFILWVKEAGVFRPAEVKLSENYDWYDGTYNLMKNCQLGTEDISPESLRLISAPYLGPVRILEEVECGNVVQKNTLLRKREFKHGTVQRIVNLAQEVAKNEGVPYFSVTYVNSPVERTWKFTENNDWLKEKMQETYSYGKDFGPKKGPIKPLEFILHPTAQLYVPRK